MFKKMLIMVSLVVLIGVSPAFAAAGVIEVNGVNHSLTTNSTGGQCLITDLGTSIDVDCTDSAGNRAYGNTVDGCLLVTGSGQCFTNPGPINTHATTEVNCAGNKYEISTGDSSGTCTNTFAANGAATGGSCSSGENGANSASVDCSNNAGSGSCDGTSGSGTCKSK